MLLTWLWKTGGEIQKLHNIMSEENTTMVPEEVIMGKIFMIRGQKVMLDADLAELYGVETK